MTRTSGAGSFFLSLLSCLKRVMAWASGWALGSSGLGLASVGVAHPDVAGGDAEDDRIGVAAEPVLAEGEGAQLVLAVVVHLHVAVHLVLQVRGAQVRATLGTVANDEDRDVCFLGEGVKSVDNVLLALVEAAGLLAEDLQAGSLLQAVQHDAGGVQVPKLLQGLLAVPVGLHHQLPESRDLLGGEGQLEVGHLLGDEGPGALDAPSEAGGCQQGQGGLARSGLAREEHHLRGHQAPQVAEGFVQLGHAGANRPEHDVGDGDGGGFLEHSWLPLFDIQI